MKTKPSFLISTILLAAGSASAQSNVTVYGNMDLGLVHESGGPKAAGWTVQSGVEAGSRLGFKGTENLGGGLQALFVIESGIAGDTGGSRPGGLAFGRQTLVGLSGGFGTLKLGRQFNLLTYALMDVDPFGGGHEGAYSNLMFSDFRTSNGVFYTSPTYQGFKASLTYAPGEVPGNSKAKRETGVAFEYQRGPLFAVFAHRTLEDATGSSRNKVSFAGATYQIGMFKGALGYATNKDPALAMDSRDLLVGATCEHGPNTYMVSWIRHDDRTGPDQDANQAAIGYTYALSKRTDLYSSYSRINNKNGAPFTVGNAIEVGSGKRGFAAGINHKF